MLSVCEIPLYAGDQSCPFGDKDLLVNAAMLDTMWCLWMSFCSVRYGACSDKAQKLPRINFEVIIGGVILIRRDQKFPGRETLHIHDSGRTEVQHA